MGGRHSQRPGPSPTLGSLGPSYQRRHKTRVSLRGPPCAHGVLGTPHEDVRDSIRVKKSAIIWFIRVEGELRWSIPMGGYNGCGSEGVGWPLGREAWLV